MMELATRVIAVSARRQAPVAAAVRAFASSASAAPSLSVSPAVATPLSRYSDTRPLTKKQTDVYYSRIAAKLDKTNTELSLEAVDRTLAYLEALGCTKNVALSAVAMHPMMTKYLPTMLDGKVDWLRANGVTGPLLVRAIARHPNILGLREQALLDLKEWYVSIGVPVSKLPYLISVFPHAASASIPDNLEPKRQFLLANGLTPKQVVSVMQRHPQFMTMGLERLESKVQSLKDRGLTDAKITNLLTNSPEVLGLAVESIDGKLRALDELLGSREATIAAWSSNARLIMYKSEQLRRAYTYLTTVVGMSPERIRRHPAVMTRSVDRMAQPRFEFLLDNAFVSKEDLEEKTHWLLISDDRFQERFPGYKSAGRKSAGSAKPKAKKLESAAAV